MELLSDLNALNVILVNNLADNSIRNQRPLVVDPVDPMNNVADFDKEIGTQVEKEATELLSTNFKKLFEKIDSIPTTKL